MIKKISRFKKIASMAVALVVSSLSVCLYSTDDSMAANTTRSYTIYNATTGAFVDDYTLDPVSSSANSRALIGTDERVIDWTKSGVVKLMSSTLYRGTGFVVDDHTIATAAHCVVDRANHVGKPLTEILLFNTSGTISLHATPIEIHVPNAYDTDSDYDYALITVEEDLSSYACFNLAAPLDSINATTTNVSVTGFPDFNNNHTNHMMYTGNGALKSMTDDTIIHLADSSSGNSGGPVYITESRNGYTYYSVIGIHHSGYENNENYAARVTTDLLHFYYNNSNL